MAHICGNDRVVFTGFDSPTYVPRGIEKSSPDESNKYYIPDVLEDLKPKVGMTFDNMDHAFAHYCKPFHLHRLPPDSVSIAPFNSTLFVALLFLFTIFSRIEATFIRRAYKFR
ncbi:hypothetical protein QVD17_16872 [Tagetes erecta]|uniref:Uncharacterized protein n=1 Tax=Tagetes erecta TaxID=13708 RepID=A0AAD8KRD5_TARER|nr:hypothetical protein QVD17_16872 [Tagetes erecta]